MYSGRSGPVQKWEPDAVTSPSTVNLLCRFCYFHDRAQKCNVPFANSRARLYWHTFVCLYLTIGILMTIVLTRCLRCHSMFILIFVVKCLLGKYLKIFSQQAIARQTKFWRTSKLRNNEVSSDFHRQSKILTFERDDS